MYASVIVCTYNRADRLKNGIISIENQTYPKDMYEIIIVNDGSMDNTMEIIDEFIRIYSNIKFVNLIENHGVCYAANSGFEVSKGEYILFTDDDCIVTPDWIERMLSHLSTHPVVVGQIRSSDHNYLALADNISGFHPLMKMDKPGITTILAGGNMALQREVFISSGGFKPGYKIMDMELGVRLLEAGRTFYYAPDVIVTHYPERANIRETMAHYASYSFYTIQLRNQYQKVLNTPLILRSSILLLVLSPFIALGETVQIFSSNRYLLRYLHTAPAIYLLKLAWCWGAFKGLRSIGK